MAFPPYLLELAVTVFSSGGLDEAGKRIGAIFSGGFALTAMSLNTIECVYEIGTVSYCNAISSEATIGRCRRGAAWRPSSMVNSVFDMMDGFGRGGCISFAMALE